jgi:lipopolysaccharide/colanic/teichoic acid biosynthesis glycosyltransferase
MRVGGDDRALRDMIARELRGEDISSGGSWKLDGDSRVTRLAAMLRRTSFDELRQLINVLRGDMTLAGPRPCLQWEAPMFPSLGTLDMLRLDVDYLRHQTLRGDVAIMARTVPALPRGDGAR